MNPGSKQPNPVVTWLGQAFAILLLIVLILGAALLVKLLLVALWA